jgi:S1-C subfamily serine protease
MRRLSCFGLGLLLFHLILSVGLGVVLFTGAACQNLARPQAVVVYERCIDGVVYIETTISEGFFRDEIAQGSGFLVDRKRSLVVTNYHVTQEKTKIRVFFPVRDQSNQLITDRNYYARNTRELQKQKCLASARIVAQDKDKDLAILQLNQMPSSARELPLASHDPKNNETLHVLGNPAARPLWRWCAGTQPEVTHLPAQAGSARLGLRDCKLLLFCCPAFHGNSGGPVLNDRGEVVGVASFTGGPGDIMTGAIHYSEVRSLLDTLVLHRVFSIDNPTRYQLHYQLRWRDQDSWQNHTIEPYTSTVHWSTGATRTEPVIKFDASFEDGYQEKRYTLKYYVRPLGRGVKPSRELDAFEYKFTVSKKNIDLVAK